MSNNGRYRAEEISATDKTGATCGTRANDPGENIPLMTPRVKKRKRLEFGPSLRRRTNGIHSRNRCVALPSGYAGNVASSVVDRQRERRSAWQRYLGQQMDFHQKLRVSRCRRVKF
jgi:hypothetical protein